MAILSKAEFAEACGGKSSNWLSVYLSRPKGPVQREDGTLDTTIPQNEIFLERHARKTAVKAARRAVTDIEIPEGLKGNGKVERVTTKDKSDSVILAFERLEKQKLELQNEELAGRTLKLRLSNEKIQGSFIPTEQVRFVLTQLSEAVHTSWENELEDILIRLSSKYGLPREEMAAIKWEKVASANRAREKAIAATKVILRRLQAETAIQRGRGEHD